MKKLIRIAIISVMALHLLGSLSTTVQADSNAINVDYVGWCLVNTDMVGKVALSFNVDLTGEHEIIVELMDNDKSLVSTGNLIVTNLKKEDNVTIDLSDAPIEFVYYIKVEVKKLPAPDEDSWEPPAGTTYLSGNIDWKGVITKPVTAESSDERCRLTIGKGTTATCGKEPLSRIEIDRMVNPPDPPKDAYVIGIFYDFQPSGAIFDPPAILEYRYEMSEIPEGVSEESMVIAFWDEVAGEWIEIDCMVNTARRTITAEIAHFTVFAIFGYVAVIPSVIPQVIPPSQDSIAPPELTPTPTVSPPSSPSTPPSLQTQVEETDSFTIKWIIIGLLVVAVASYFIIKLKRTKKG